MADDEKLTQKTENSSPIGTDIMEIVDDPGGTPLSQKITLTNLFETTLITAAVGAASTSAAGKIEIATTAEINTGDDTARALGVKQFADSNFARAKFGWIHTQSDAGVATGNGVDGIPIPIEMNGMNIIDVLCVVHDKGITGATDIQIRRRRAGSDVDVLTVKVTLGNEFFARDGTINTSNDDLATGDMLYPDVDAVHSGTAPNGLSIVITAGLP